MQTHVSIHSFHLLAIQWYYNFRLQKALQQFLCWEKAAKDAHFCWQISSFKHILGVPGMKIELRMYLNLINYLITSVLFWCITTNQIFPSLTFTVFKCISYLLFITALNTFNLVFGLIFIINNFRQLQLHVSGNTSLHVGNLFKALHMTELENKLEKKKINILCIYFPATNTTTKLH